MPVMKILISMACGGVIGYCFEPNWQAALGVVAMVVLIVNSARP